MSANQWTVGLGTPTLPLDDERHGTYNGYVNLACRCRDCRDANTAMLSQQKARRAVRLRADPSLAPHGRYTTYHNWSCRCAPCTAAATDYDRGSRQRRKAAR